MKPLVLTVIVGLLAETAMTGTQSRPRAQHVLQGPYEFDEHAKPQPRFFVLDDKPYYSIDQLKLAISQLPPGSRVHWAGQLRGRDGRRASAAAIHESFRIS